MLTEHGTIGGHHRPVYFAETPTEALHGKLAALNAIPQLKLRGLPMAEIADEYRAVLGETTVYQWGEDTTQQVAEAATSFPLESRVYVPAMANAFCTFSRPVLRYTDPALFAYAGPAVDCAFNVDPKTE